MLPKGDFYALYPFGSRVYGTARPDSDWDYIGIREGADVGDMDMGLINVKLMTPEHFQYRLNEHGISALEAYFLPESMVAQSPPQPWKCDIFLPKLRASISEKASHSFVKAKKKLISPYDWANAKKERDRGKKSLFHSLRILQFGIQIARDGRITDYESANEIFEEIMTEPDDSWDNYNKRWKPEYNRLCTEFRKLAPKD